MSGELLARITFPSGEVVEATVENTMLYLHFGELAMYDHVFIGTGEKKGMYVWSHDKHYPALVRNLKVNQGQMILNLREVNELDLTEFDSDVSSSFANLDQVPDEWASES